MVADVCVYDDPSIIDALYMDRIESRAGLASPPRLMRYRLDLAGGECATEQLTEIPFELPRIDYGRRNAQAVPLRVRHQRERPAPVGRTCSRRSTSATARSSSGTSPAATRVSRCSCATPKGTAEDDGVALSVVLDSASGRSFLLVLDARTWQERARAEAPQHVPFGFHGQFFR